MEILITAIIPILILIFFIKNERDKARVKWETENTIINREYPYIIKGYHFMTQHYYTKYNEKSSVKAIKIANELTTKLRPDGKVECDKVEVVYNESIIHTSLTNNKIKISDLDGFSLSRYNGVVLQSSRVKIDSLNLQEIGKLYILLTSGEEILIESPVYSLQEYSLRGHFIKNLTFVDDYTQQKRCIPINIIQRIIKHSRKKKDILEKIL